MSTLNDNDNRRGMPRKEAMQQISAENSVDGEPMGIIINLHTEGFMLLGNDTLSTYQVYNVEFRFDYPINGANNLQLNARSTSRTFSRITLIPIPRPGWFVNFFAVENPPLKAMDNNFFLSHLSMISSGY